MPSTILLRSTGVFPTSGSPRILWIGVDDPRDGLKTLVERLESECEQEGFPREQRPFSPHLTIGRLRKPNGAREVAIQHQEMGFEEVEVAVNQLLVIRSELTSSGPHYSVLSRFGLSG
jgi:2'-5' RNA ligase